MRHACDGHRPRAILSELGEVSRISPLRDPAKGDFRPAKAATGIGEGVKVFVPWSLSGVVGEWNFYPAGNDPTNLIDEHWYMTDYHVYVGGTPEGPYLEGTLDFLRMAQGTLSDADTTIEELYAWEFDGPQMRDFTGRESTGARNAGAIEFAP